MKTEKNIFSSQTTSEDLQAHNV